MWLPWSLHPSVVNADPGHDMHPDVCEIGSSDSIGESENAEPTLEPDEEDLGAGLQEEDEDDILFWNVSISISLGAM